MSYREYESVLTGKKHVPPGHLLLPEQKPDGKLWMYLLGPNRDTKASGEITPNGVRGFECAPR